MRVSEESYEASSEEGRLDGNSPAVDPAASILPLPQSNDQSIPSSSSRVARGFIETVQAEWIG